jgi:membrane-associated phospholipid phosphatase
VTAVSHVESTPRERRFGVFLAAEAGLWLSLYAVYFVIRGETIAGAQEAMANARSVVDIERAMGLAHERFVQNAIGTADYLGTFFAHYYELGFFPVVIAGLVYLARVDRVRYRDTRNIMLVAIGVAMVMFLLLPVAPPRLVPDLGIADTVGMDTHDTGTKYGVRYNPYAAMPSMHVGWTLLIGIAVFLTARHLITKVLAAAYPVLMTIAVIATGNHYILDAIVGAVIALGALVVWRWYAGPVSSQEERASAHSSRRLPRASDPSAATRSG